jgi:DNA adenine methylase
MNAPLRAPFPYFGGKRSVADYVWSRLGSPKQYIEPFAGSAAILLAAPKPASLEVIGDLSGYVANFWRCVKFRPDDTWSWADYPVSHIDQIARHRWLTDPERCAELRDALLDPEWPGDPQIAGWWLWGQCSWIGSGWCEWQKALAGKIPHVSDAGRGVQAAGKIPHVGNPGMGWAWIRRLSTRLERVRVIHGTWDRCLNHHYGKEDTAVFLDPPYIAFEKLYGDGAEPVALQVAEWARKNQSLRIALCGHVGDYDMPGWDVYRWSRKGTTYGSTGTKDEEAVWFSPGCERESGQLSMFGEAAE